MTAERPAHRGTIHLEDAEIVAHVAHSGEQYILRVHAPQCARIATAGSFAHIRCDADIPMRRPISIMSVDAERGHVDFLYKIVGDGLRALSRQQAGQSVSILGPIGNGFTPSSGKPRKLMIGGGVGVPPMLFLAEQLAAQTKHSMDDSLVLMGSEVPFPFDVLPSKLTADGIADDATHALAALERLGVASRLASLQSYSGVHKGYVTDLARQWLTALSEPDLAATEVFACGPEPMLEAVAKLVAEFKLPCQLCLEEYMACAVGGCAGCTVPVHLPEGIAMKRVCVDGPVFSAASIYPDSTIKPI